VGADAPELAFRTDHDLRCHHDRMAENNAETEADPVPAAAASHPVQPTAGEGTPPPSWLPETYAPPPGFEGWGTAGGTAGTPATTTAESGTPDGSPPSPRRRDQLLWLWPALSLLLIAVAGQIWQTNGALLAGLLAGSTLVLLMGSDVLHGWPGLAIAVATTAAMMAVVVGHLAGLDGLARTWTPVGQPEAGHRPLDLRGHRVTDAEIRGKNLRGALLSGSVLDELDLTGVSLIGADARGASFRDANLERADLRGADLSGSDLRRTCLYRTDLSGARLDGANAQEADVSSAIVSKNTTARAASWPGPTDRAPPDVCS